MVSNLLKLEALVTVVELKAIFGVALESNISVSLVLGAESFRRFISNTNPSSNMI